MKSLVVVLLFLYATASAQDISWEKKYAEAPIGHDVVPLADGGFIAIGNYPINIDGMMVTYLVRTGADGVRLWEMTFRAEYSIAATALYPSGDTAVVVLGWMQDLYGGDSTHRVWLAKVGIDGNFHWERVLGPGNTSRADRTSDGGFVLMGTLDSAIMLARVDGDGRHIWTRRYMEGRGVSAASVRQTSDGGYVVVGSAVVAPRQHPDAILLRTDANGDSLWSGSYGFETWESGTTVEETSDGGFILSGTSRVYGADQRRFGWMFLVGTDANGSMRWSRTLPVWVRDTDSVGINDPYMSRKDKQGNVVISGSTGPDLTLPMLIQVDPDGSVAWKKLLGTLEFSNSIATAFRPLDDGGFIVTGIKHNQLLLLRVAGTTSDVDETWESVPRWMDLR